MSARYDGRMHTTQRWATAAAALAFFISTLDTGITNVALPQLAHVFHTNASGAAWTIGAYAAALALAILPFGRIADRAGILPVCGVGFVLFGVFSIGCAAAPSMPLLIAFRAATGIAAAMLQATSAAFVTRYAERSARPHAFGTVSSVLSLGTVLGPSLGGTIVSIASWRWIFLAVLPFCAIGAICVARLRGANHVDDGVTQTEHITGAARAIPFLCAAGLGAAFIAIFCGAPFALQHAGFSPWSTGLLMLGAPIGSTLSAKLAGRALRAGRGARSLVLGPIVCAVVSLVLLVATPAHVAAFALLLFAWGLGSGTLQTPTIAFSLAAFDPQRQAQAAAFQRFVQNIAIAAGAQTTGTLIDHYGSAAAWIFATAVSSLTALAAAQALRNPAFGQRPA
jgi:MFS family permease